MNNYNLNENYICNLTKDGKAVPFCNDEHGSSFYQIKVYEYARKLIEITKVNNLLDVGCGYGIKLQKIIYPVCKDIVGIDKDEVIKYCKAVYSFGDWYNDDIENSTLKLNKKFDLIISSDVIEHMVNPDKLLSYIKNCSHERTHIIISTPERDRILNQNSMGPPRNLNHVREWNMSEFKAYLQSRNFHIIRHFLLGEKVSSYKELLKKILCFEPIRKIQVIHCLKKN